MFRGDYGAFLSLVRIGDRLEMKRESYCHWAIFVGEQFVEIDEQVRKGGRTFVHRVFVFV